MGDHLFKKGKIENAEDKIIKTHHADSHLIPGFLELELECDSVNSDWQTSSVEEDLLYSTNDVELLDFADWLAVFVQKEKFTASHGR